MQVNLSQLEIPKASAYAMQALDIVTQAEPDLKQLEQAIMHDPLLASSLLRYANSPLHRRATEITNVPSALKLLGLNSIKSAIVTATIRSMLPVDSQIGQVILKHMFDIAALCKLIGQQCCAQASDDLEFLGLVHDVGMLTLAANYDRTYARLLHESLTNDIALDELEQSEFGMTHDAVTVKTIEAFRLPKHYAALLQHFHSGATSADVSETGQRNIAVLSLAHLLLAEYGQSAPHFAETIVAERAGLMVLLHLQEDQIQAIQQSAALVLSQNLD